MPAAAALGRARAAYGAVGVLVGLVALFVGVLVGFGFLWALLVAILVGAACATGLYLSADALAMRALGAERIAPGSHPRLENVLEGLSVAHGFRQPELHLIDDAAPNAAVVGRTPRSSCLILTTGLLERLGRVELEGVLAHELMRIRTRQPFLDVTVATLIARPLGFAPGLSSSLARRVLDTDTLVLTDAAGAAITRYPPGLRGGLESIRSDGRVVKNNPRAYRHLWMDVPEGAVVEPAFSLDDRIAVLHEL
jgi:heat shock protein HtpX